MEQLSTLLANFGISRTWATEPRPVDSFRPDDDNADVALEMRSSVRQGKDESVADSHLLVLKVGAEHSIDFAQNVGFRYSSRKQQRMAVVSSYYSMTQLAADRTAQLLALVKQELSPLGTAPGRPSNKAGHRISTSSAYESALCTVKAAGLPSLAAHFLPKPSALDAILEGHSLPPSNCIEVNAFLTHVGASHLFSRQVDCTTADEVMRPLRLQVLARRSVGVRRVYDVSVPVLHNFIAEGVVVHNCKARGAKSGGDSGVGDTVVNQLLSKMDGVNSLNNILVIGMTNRKDLIDPALLRPGRLEVHIEISLPDEKGRVQILNIHTKTMKENGRLAKDVDIFYLAQQTKNFSGAELEGLVKSATSFALYQAVDLSGGAVAVQKEKEKDIKVTAAAFEHALQEVKPSFGVDEDELGAFIGDLYDYGEAFERVMAMGRGFIEQVRYTQRQRLVPVLFSGAVGSGKTTVAAKLARDSGFPFVRMIRPSQYLGMTELSKTARIAQVFEDAYKSPLSCIVIDSVENLIEYIPIGPRFSNATLQTLIAFCSQPPPHADRKLLVFATTNKPDMFKELGIETLFQVVTVPALRDSDEVRRVLDLLQVEVDGGEQEKELIALSCPLPMSIKTLLNKIDFYTRGNKANAISADIWKEA